MKVHRKYEVYDAESVYIATWDCLVTAEHHACQLGGWVKEIVWRNGVRQAYAIRWYNDQRLLKEPIN